MGMVTNKRVVLKYRSGEEDIPIQKITSIAFQHKRGMVGFIISLLGAIGLVIFMIVNIEKFDGGTTMIFCAAALVLMLAAVANWIGRHYLVVSTGGKFVKPLKVEMAKTKDGKELYKAIDKAVFS